VGLQEQIAWLSQGLLSDQTLAGFMLTIAVVSLVAAATTLIVSLAVGRRRGQRSGR
jgi:hypothetical protein